MMPTDVGERAVRRGLASREPSGGCVPRLAARAAPALLAEVARRYEAETFIRKQGKGLSFRDVERRSSHLARALLSRGVGKGSRVGILMPNGPDWIVGWLAVNRIGAIAVLISTFFVGRELGYAIRHADVSVLLCAEKHLRHDYISRLEEALDGLRGQSGRTALALPSAPYLREIWLTSGVAAWSAGAIEELMAIGAASEPFGEDLLKAVEDAVAPSDEAVIIYTSGSTAAPKGVVHTQQALVDKALFLAEGGGIMPLGTRRGDGMIITHPMFWVGGLLSMISAMALGARVIFADDHSPASLLQLIGREDAVQLTGSEGALRTLRDASRSVAGLDALRPQNTNQLPFFYPETPRTRFPFALGMTETCGPHSGLNDGGLLPPGAEGSVGPALAGVEYRIVDPESGRTLEPGQAGELQVRSPWMMQGLYKRPRAEVFTPDGYYATGDRCVLRGDGYLFFEGRIGGMIKTSGANVSPEEVEAVISAEAGVIEVAVLGLPDDRIGQLVVAVVVKEDGSPLDETALRSSLRRQLSSFKVPKAIFFVSSEALPRTPSNKIRKPAMVEMVSAWLREADATSAANAPQ